MKHLAQTILICAAFVSTSAYSTNSNHNTIKDAVIVYDNCHQHSSSKTCVAVSDFDNTAAVESEAKTRKKADAALSHRINTNKADNAQEVADRKAGDDALSGRVSDNKTYIESVDSKITHFNSSHDVFTAAIDKNTNDIAHNRAAISNNTSRINGLDLRVRDLANELESSAAQLSAISSLPQPYGIGNSMLSVGLGHYGSANALAVGFAHRCSEGVVTKFGISMSNGRSVSTLMNGSVGFEF